MKQRGFTDKLEEVATGGEDFAEDFDAVLSDIGSSNTVHDKFQFESKFDFDLKPHGDEPEKKYDIDFYFFFPKSMGINSETYTRENFYSDLTNYLRIRTPEIFQWSRIRTNGWSIPAADRYFRVHLATQKRQRYAGLVIQEVKLFGCYINTQLKKLESDLIRLLRRKTDLLLARRERILQNRLTNIEELIRTYRDRYMKRLKEQPILIDEEVKRSFLLTDEYISYRLESILITIHELIETHHAPSPWIKEQIFAILSSETYYRQESNMVNLENEDDEAARTETYYYRLGLLKKYVSEVLYLQVENVKKEKTYRNIIAAFGAALAAVWAGLADFQRFQMMSGKDVSVRLFTIISLGVIAYVFKDRIKELSKEYFNEKLKHRIPDFDVRMFYSHFDEGGQEKRLFFGFIQGIHALSQQGSATARNPLHPRPRQPVRIRTGA